MSALLASPVALLAAFGLALLLVPLIAVAMLTFDRARKHRREDHVRGHAVMDARIRAKVEAMIWPE